MRQAAQHQTNRNEQRKGLENPNKQNGEAGEDGRFSTTRDEDFIREPLATTAPVLNLLASSQHKESQALVSNSSANL